MWEVVTVDQGHTPHHQQQRNTQMVTLTVAERKHQVSNIIDPTLVTKFLNHTNYGKFLTGIRLGAKTICFLHGAGFEDLTVTAYCLLVGGRY